MPPRGIKELLAKKLQEREKRPGASSSAKPIPPAAPQPQKRPPPPSSTAEGLPESKRVKAHVTKGASEAGGSAQKVAEAQRRGKEPSSELPWEPSFITTDKKQVLMSDSLKEDPSLALTLFGGLMLPKDVASPPSLKAALAEYYFHAARATQSVIGAQRFLIDHDKQAKLLKQKVEASQAAAEEYKKSLAESDEARRGMEIEMAILNDLVKGLQEGAKRARAEGVAEGKTAERLVMEAEMKALGKQEFDRGYLQAEEDAVDQILALQGEMKAEQHKKSFMLGFNAGLTEAGIELKDERRTLKTPPPLESDAATEAEPPAEPQPSKASK